MICYVCVTKKGNKMTLLKETVEAIGRSGHKVDDIIFIGSEKTGHSCTWKEFEKLADKEYDKGFGSSQVAQDLIIVFSDNAKMWRGEYDGSEWWEYSTPFKMPNEKKTISGLFATVDQVGWVDLAEINK
jgi:hypothetical protein